MICIWIIHLHISWQKESAKWTQEVRRYLPAGVLLPGVGEKIMHWAEEERSPFWGTRLPICFPGCSAWFFKKISDSPAQTTSSKTLAQTTFPNSVFRLPGQDCSCSPVSPIRHPEFYQLHSWPLLVFPRVPWLHGRQPELCGLISNPPSEATFTPREWVGFLVFFWIWYTL